MPSALKKSSSGVSLSRPTLKCLAARFRISSRVCSCVGISLFDDKLTVSDSRQIGLRICALHKLAQTYFHRGLREQLTEQIDFLFQLIIRNGLNELLGRDRCAPVELA